MNDSGRERMHIRFSGKNLRVTKGIKAHLYEKLEKLTKYAPRIVETHAVLTKEKYLYHAHITLSGKSLHVFGEGSEKENVYAAIDQAVDRVQKQLKKFRDKVKDHHKKHGENAVAPKVRIADKMLKEQGGGDPRPRIIQMPAYAPKPMNIQEASMQLELGSDPFLVFSNAETDRPSVIFKLADGNHGLIEPEF